MQKGTNISLILMLFGLIMVFFHMRPYGVKLIYGGVGTLILTPCISLVYFIVHFFYNNEKKYALISLLILLFLSGVIAFKVFV